LHLVGPAERLDRYARLAVEVAVNLQPGQFLRVSADPEHLPLVRAIGRVAY
jgi:leucyl aminopeptidase (aminopeptidase T)